MLHQLGQASLTALVSIGFAGVGQNDGVQLAGQVVKHHHGVGDHQQNVRIAQRIGVRAGRQLLLDVAHAVIAEVAHQTAIEARQAGNWRDLITLLEGLDKGQRVFAVVLLDHHVIDAYRDLVLVGTQHGAARQADDRVTPPLLAALHRLQQIGVRRVGQLQVQGQRGVEIRQGFDRHRDTVIAGSG